MERYRLAYVFAPYRGNSASESLTDALCRVNRTVWWGPGSSTEKDGAFSGPGTARHNGQLQIASAVEGLLRRDFGNYLTLDGACAHRSAADLAAIAREAGVHIYGASPVHIMAGAELAPGETAPLATVRVDLLTVHVNAPGSYPISLPDGAQAIQMRDVFSGKRLSAGGGFDFESLDVALFVRDGVAFPRPPTPEVNLRPSLKGM